MVRYAASADADDPCAMTDELILHHYPMSPFSEKVRLALGLKGVA